MADQRPLRKRRRSYSQGEDARREPLDFLKDVHVGMDATEVGKDTTLLASDWPPLFGH